VKVPGKLFHRVHVGADRVLWVVATLEFIQHLLPKMGHKSLLVTQALHSRKSWGTTDAAASAAPAA
jgi:hypothetical protein